MQNSKHRKNVIIIGAGIGGLTTAIHLARNGFFVKIFEKNNSIGGRCSSVTKDGHSFETGATLLMMTDVYDQTWKLFDKDLFNELNLIRMDPIYRLHFPGDKKFDFSSDLSCMKDQLEIIEKGSFSKMLEYLDKSYQVYQLSMKHIIDRNFIRATEFFTLKNLVLMLKLNAFKNHYKQASRYFKNEMLRTIFTFQNIYVGQNPFNASAIFSMLPFLELTDGVWYPKGGMVQIAENLQKIAREHGVEIVTDSNVESIVTNKTAVEGIKMSSGEIIESDIIVCNADLPNAYEYLLPDSAIASKMKNKDHTCSAIIFHWALDKEFPQFQQHNVFVSDNYEENLDAVFNDKPIQSDTSFYVHAPLRSNKSVAPPGHDSISLLVPVSHLTENNKNDLTETRKNARKLALKRLEKEGVRDIEKHIKFEIVYNQKSWQTIYNVSKGSVFGSLSHKIMQMGYLRPHNQHKKYKNLFFVGGSTHPGNGVPMVLLSAKHVANRIFDFAGVQTTLS